MSFRRALLAFAFCAIAPAAAAADDGRLIQGGYEITFAGFSGFRIDFTARFDNGRYDVESWTFKEGVLKAITMNYEVRNRSWGSYSPRGARPNGGSLSVMVGREPRTWLAQYGADGSLTEVHNPPWKPEPKDTIPEDKKPNSFDPLTASLMVGMMGNAACEQVAASNDGKRRIDVMLKQIRTETPAQAGVPQAKGEVLVCEVYSRRVAGQFFDTQDEAEAKREQPMVMWLAHLNDMPIVLPVRLEAKTGFGTIRGRLLSFTDRPLTPEEKIAMQR